MSNKYRLCVLLSLLVARSALSQDSTATLPGPSETTTRLAVRASAVTTNEYQLPAVGTLHLVVPSDWGGTFKKTIVMGTRADEIQFQPKNADGFAVMVTAVHMNPESARDFNTKEVLTEAVQKELPDSVEKTADIHGLNGPEVKGHYLSLTDATMSAKDAKPGQYKYVTTGYAKLGSLVLILRVGSNLNGDEKFQALELVRTARLTAGAP
ncbi:MAG TPA: hypothetical protein VN281_18890 [Verrucomicrobiae bacterium]|nr:hypothetical protein [Verrucomicrobiae bacterium]